MKFKMKVDTSKGPKWLVFDKEAKLRVGLTLDEDRATEFETMEQRDRALAALTRIGTPFTNPKEVSL